jgi:hypothetical protein
VTVLPIEIACISFDLRLHGPRPQLQARYGTFVRRGGPPEFTLDLRPGPLDGIGHVTGRPVALGTRWHVAGAEHLGWLDPTSRTGEAIADPSLVVVNGLIRAALAREVQARGGILVHAAALQVDGRAHLVPGRSGAGKSTLAARAGHPLSDELAALLPGPRGWIVHATPWWTSRGGEAPLAAMYTLAWGDPRVERLRGGAGALRHLATNLLLPFDAVEDRERAFATCAAVAAAAPFARLHFRPDTHVDALLRAGAAARAA